MHTAIPYSQPMVTGTGGISKAITFIVTDTTLAGAVGVSTLSPIASLPANLTAGLNGVLYLDENRNGEVETTEPPL
ncbi:MAG: hypothetical protein R2932_11980 [Caldilineaceae bacterium]